MRRLFPCYEQNTDPNIVIITNPTTETEPEPEPEPTTEIPEAITTGVEIGTEIGQLKAKVERLQTEMLEQIQASQSALRESQSAWEMAFEAKYNPIQPEPEPEPEPEDEETPTEGIPELPNPAPQEQTQETQEEPKPRGNFWNVRNWL